MIKIGRKKDKTRTGDINAQMKKLHMDLFGLMLNRIDEFLKIYDIQKREVEFGERIGHDYTEKDLREIEGAIAVLRSEISDIRKEREEMQASEVFANLLKNVRERK
jgi:uncharacterized small protein (DUF1192 family)